MRKPELDQRFSARDAAAEAVARARSLLVNYTSGSQGFEKWEKDNGELVTSADLAADELIKVSLAESRLPTIVRSEESQGRSDTFSRSWLVDPLCGTVPFSLGMGNWGSSVALQDSGCLIAGAFSTLESSEPWSGGAEIGAWQGSTPVSLGVLPTTLEKSIIGFEKSNGAAFSRLGHLYRQVLKQAAHVHTYGSSVYMGAQVCAGRIAAALFPDTDPVHVAGVAAVAEGLGFFVTDGQGRQVDWAAHNIDLILIATPQTHKQILQALA